jgi:4'-phosphopantetheinyl transferase EntD
MLTRLETILPPGAVAVEGGDEVPGACLLPEEAAVLGPVVDARRREFTSARTCARRALARLGLSSVPILPGPNREPLWPGGVVGSITHCAGYCAAAVASNSVLSTLGIDAEVHDALPEEVRNVVLLEEERCWLRTRRTDSIHWDRVLFSAKESLYKAWFPMTGRWLDFTEALVTVDLSQGTLHAELCLPGPNLPCGRVRGFEGRYLISPTHVLTAMTLSG